MADIHDIKCAKRRSLIVAQFGAKPQEVTVYIFSQGNSLIIDKADKAEEVSGETDAIRRIMSYNALLDTLLGSLRSHSHFCGRRSLIL